VSSEIAAIRQRSPLTRIDAVAIRRADYTFSELAAWRDAVFDALLGRYGIVGLDLNEQTNRVRLQVDQRLLFGVRASITKALDSLAVDTNAVSIVAGAPVEISTGSAPTFRYATKRRAGASLLSSVDTIVGGIKFARKRSTDTNQVNRCTIGTVIDYGGSRGFLTASHCTWQYFEVDGTYAHQADSTGPRIGYEAYDPSWWYCTAWYYRCRGTDAAVYLLYSPYSSAQSKVGLIAKPVSSSSTWGTSGSTSWDSTNPYFIIVFASSSFSGGEVVAKVGYATGWTTGTITSTCVDRGTGVSDFYVTCSMETSVYVDGGDSGSPVFSSQTSAYDFDVNFAGIMWGRDTGAQRSYFSPIGRITNDLTSSMAVVRPTSLSQPTISGSIQDGVPGISWSNVSGATYYQVWRWWYRYPSETGSDGWEYLGHLSSTFWDSEMSVEAYTGTTVPNFSTEGWVKYYIVAFGGAELSPASAEKYFRLAPP
jgi:hypothetical protein